MPVDTQRSRPRDYRSLPLGGVAACLITLGALAGCSTQPKEYVIGAAGPQKVAYGIQNQHGIDLAVEEINQAGGINGVPLRVIVRDDGGSGAEAAKIAGELSANPNVLAVVGHAGSGAMVSAARVYDGGRLVAVGTTPSSPDLSGISPWTFRMITSDSVNGIMLAKFADGLANKLGRRVRAAILYHNDAYGRGLSEAFQHAFQGDIISNDPVGPETNFEPYVAYFKQQKPDVVFVASDEDIGIPFLREARWQKLDALFLGGDGWQGVSVDPGTQGVYIGTPFTAQSADTAVQRFAREFQAKFGTVPDAHAALAYDATKLIARALAEAGPNRAKIRTYLAGLTESTEFHGVSGTTRFAATNDPVGDHFRVTRIDHGLLVPVEHP